MDWSQYRKTHLKKYGPTTRAQLSKDYQEYKKNITRKSPKRSPKATKKLTLQDINKLAKNKQVFIVVLYADFCGHCRAMKEKLGPKMKNTDKIMFYNDKQIDESLKEYFPKIFYYENGQRQNDLIVDDIYDYLL